MVEMQEWRPDLCGAVCDAVHVILDQLRTQARVRVRVAIVTKALSV